MTRSAGLFVCLFSLSGCVRVEDVAAGWPTSQLGRWHNKAGQPTKQLEGWHIEVGTKKNAIGARVVWRENYWHATVTPLLFFPLFIRRKSLFLLGHMEPHRVCVSWRFQMSCCQRMALDSFSCCCCFSIIMHKHWLTGPEGRRSGLAAERCSTPSVIAV